MSAPERGGRVRRASATPGALPASAASDESASTLPGGGAAQLAAEAQRPGVAAQPPLSPPSAAPVAADAPSAVLAALSLHSAVPVGVATAGGDAVARGQAASPVYTNGGAGSAASASPGAGASARPGGAGTPSGGAPAPGPAAEAAPPSPPPGGAPVPDAGPPVPVGDDGAPLSAEAAASPFSPPASERHAAFLRLVDHKAKAALQLRHMREADFSALAADAGAPLFGDESLIVAYLRVCQVKALSNQAYAEPDRSEAEALVRRGWVVLLAQALPVIQGRMDGGTLLPGGLRKVEEAYHSYETQLARRVKEKPAACAVQLRAASSAFGFEAALYAAVAALCYLQLRPWRAEQVGRAQAFVLAALRLVPKTAGVPFCVPSEETLVDVIGGGMSPGNYGADFCASVLALWRSPAVANVLRSRGSLQTAPATLAAADAEFEARQRADLAKRGLRVCALPSCGRREATVLQFRVCGHCHTTRYCCPEHAKLHWKAHKREYEAEEEAGGR